MVYILSELLFEKTTSKMEHLLRQEIMTFYLQKKKKKILFDQY